MHAFVAAGMMAALLSAPTAASPDYTPVIQTLDAEIPQLMQQYQTVGLTLALVDGDTVIAAKGYGYADKAAAKPVDASTMFHIGSLSKTFSGLAVMKLVEQGRIDLDAPVTTYLPEFRLAPRYENNVITVRTILDHHSGIPGDVFNGLITRQRPDPGFRQWLLKALPSMTPERRVNTLQAYNNSGFVLLQNIVENVTGEPFDTWSTANLFTPMGMTDSSFNDTVAPDSALTRNYWITGGKVVPRPREYVNGWTAGSILSNATDMAKYLQTVLRDGQPIVTPATFQQMLTPQTNLPLDIMPATVGLSWFMYPRSWAGKTVLHDGATGYNFSMLQFLPDSDIGVFVSTNTLGGSEVSATVAGRALALAYTAKTGISKPEAQPLPTAAFTKSAGKGKQGVWATATSYDTIVAKKTHLNWTSSGTTSKLRKMSNGWWDVSDNPTMQVRFTTVQGRRVMLSRFAGPVGPLKVVVGQFAPATSVNTSWRKRLGSYRATNVNPSVVKYLVFPRMRLEVQDGHLLMVRGDNIQVLNPMSKTKAYSFGMGGTLGRNKGDSLVADGTRLKYMGMTYKPVHE
jgi:CubicO group peptidase (beta-lactamase class C family)